MKLKKYIQIGINSISNFFFDNKEKRDSIVLFRITIGIVLLLHFLSVQKDFAALYGENSIIPSDIQSVYIKNVFLFNDIVHAINTITRDSVLSLYVYKLLYITCCLFIITGFFSRFSAIILIFLQVGLVKSAYYFAYGADYFTTLSLFYIILHPGDKYFSLRGFLWKYDTKQPDSPFYKLQKLHLNFAYFVSGLEKLTGFNWRNGESIWKAIHLPNFSNDFNINIDFLGKFPIIFIIAGWATILVELLYPLFMNIKKTQKLGLISIISLHLGIALFLNLYFFSAIMIIWNITTYYFDINENEKSIIQL